MSDEQRLENVITARHPCVFISTFEEAEALYLVRRIAINRGLDLRLWSINGGLRDGLISDGVLCPDTEHPAAALYSMQQNQNPRLYVMLDLIDHLKDQRTLRLLRDLIQHIRDIGGHLILIDHDDAIPHVISAYATRFDLSLPDRDEIDDIVRDTLRRQNHKNELNVDMTRGTFHTITRNLCGLSRRQIEQIAIETVAEDCEFNADDLNHVLARKRQLIQTGGLLEYVKAPVDMDEIAGMQRLKTWLAHRSAAINAERRTATLGAPRGILLLGVPGAGKSFCAKAIATAWKRPLLRMDVGALYDRYIGESEKRLRDALRQAEVMSPVILWIDEIEKAFASAASRSSDGGLSQRMFGALLTWMQEHEAPVFLVATANDIEALPPELLRKGRFDEVFFVDLPEQETREAIFDIHLQKRGCAPSSFDMDALVEASDGYSGAEIEQAIIASLFEASADADVLTTDYLLKTLRTSPPLAVTMKERVHALRTWAKGRCVPAN